jgi:hypothetical protein
MSQKLAVPMVEPVPPQVLTQPGSAHWPDPVVGGIDRGGATPEIGVVMQDPTTCAVLLLRDEGAAVGYLLE